MFKSKAKKRAIERLRSAQEIYAKWVNLVTQNAQELYDLRKSTAVGTISKCEEYINTLANSPKACDKSIAEYKVEYREFANLSRQIEIEAQKQVSVRRSTVGAGVATGAGVAAFGPSAAMAIATTFGTASTGTAISTLSGAAATNAALAWLGGGALAAGGSGIAGGSALLALAGPIGWTIGGVAIAGGAMFANSQNEKAAKEATAYAVSFESDIKKLIACDTEITNLKELTQQHADGVLAQLKKLYDCAPNDYCQFSTEQKQIMAALINNIQSLCQCLKKKLA